MTAGSGAPARLAHLPALLAVTGGLLTAAAAVGWLAGGAPAAAGAAAGVAVVAASYLLSTLVLAWADSIHPSLVLPAGLITYVVKIALIGVGMVAVLASGWDGMRPMGVGVVVGVVGWIATHIWWLTRHQPRIPGSRPASPGGS